MTRSKLISLLADKHPQLTASDVVLVVKAVIDSIGNHLIKGGRVEIRRFGSFSARTRPPRLGRNPMTGEIVPVPGKRVPHFKPGIELRERVNVEHVEQRDKLKESA
jgi:integration host factor subunit beta